MKYKLNGYLTIFLSLSLTIILSIFFVLIRSALVNYSKMKLECVTDIGMNAVLGEYHRELLEQYDLLFIDMSYGTSNGGIYQLENHLTDFINHNLQPAKNSVSAWNSLALQNIRVTEILMPHHYAGKILKRQACAYVGENTRAEAMKDLTSLLTEAESLDGVDEMLSWQNVMSKITTILSALTQEARQQALEANPEADVSKISITIDNPADDTFDNASHQIEALIDGDKKGGNIMLSNYFSYRSTGQEISQPPKYDTSAINEIASTILLKTYIFEKIGYLKNVKEGSLLDYQIEYLIVGADSDEKNLKGVKRRIFGWRLADNVRLYFSDSQKQKEATAYATAISALLLRPELTELIAKSLLFSWAFSDSIDDVNKILDGDKVPLIKKSIKSTGEGLLYHQYLELMLLITKESKVLARIMDIIEMDIRLTPNNQNFRIDLCIESFRVSVDFCDQYERYYIDRRYGYY